jgi:hypothetical protein
MEDFNTPPPTPRQITPPALIRVPPRSRTPPVVGRPLRRSFRLDTIRPSYHLVIIPQNDFRQPSPSDTDMDYNSDDIP